MVNYKKQGKRNKRRGVDFERRTRKDLESKGWIVSKWQNNVEFGPTHLKNNQTGEIKEIGDLKLNILELEDKYTLLVKDGRKGKCVPAKPGRFRMMQTGFPDFIAYKTKPINASTILGAIDALQFKLKSWQKLDIKKEVEFQINKYYSNLKEVIFIECKTNGYLSKEEKEKARWYLENNYCSKFLIAHKEKDPNDKRKVLVKYKDFEEYDNKNKRRNS